MSKAKVIIEKAHGLFNLNRLYVWFVQAADGVYLVEVKKVHKPRTNDQNGWLWGCIYPLMLDALNDAGWDFVNVEQVHEFFKSIMTKESVVNKETGEIVEFPTSTATMNTVAFSAYCEKLRDYAREYLNMEIPDPDKYWRLRE